MNKRKEQKKVDIHLFVERLFSEYDLCEELKKEVKAYRVLFGITEDRLERQNGFNADLFTKCAAKDEIVKRGLDRLKIEKQLNKELSKRVDGLLVSVDKLNTQLLKAQGASVSFKDKQDRKGKEGDRKTEEG